MKEEWEDIRIRICAQEITLGHYPNPKEAQLAFFEAYKEFYGVEPKINWIRA